MPLSYVMQTLISQLIPYKNINYFTAYFTTLHQITNCFNQNHFWPSTTARDILKLYLFLTLQLTHFLYLYFVEPPSKIEKFIHYDIFRLVDARPEYYLLVSMMLLMIAYCVHLLYFCPPNQVFFLIEKIIIFKQSSWFLQTKTRKKSKVSICLYITRYTLLLSTAIQNLNVMTGNEK